MTFVRVKTTSPSDCFPLVIPSAAHRGGGPINGTQIGPPSKDAYARHNGTAPLPVWSGNRTRHRLPRTGNRQLNTSMHRSAVTQKRCHDGARAYLDRRMANGNTKSEALRALKRKLSDVVYRALLADAISSMEVAVGEAA
jgi:transposase